MSMDGAFVICQYGIGNVLDDRHDNVVVRRVPLSVAVKPIGDRESAVMYVEVWVWWVSPSKMGYEQPRLMVISVLQ